MRARTTTTQHPARMATIAVSGVMVLATGLYAAVVSSPSQAAGSNDRAAAANCSTTAAKPRPIWTGNKSLEVSPNNPIPRERVRLRGKLAKPVPRGATLLVQVKRAGKAWQTVDKDRSISHKGKWTARFRAPSKTGPVSVRSLVHDSRSRVVATSKPRRLRVTKLRLHLTLPESISVDEPFEATLAISPARPGARVDLLMRLEPPSGAKVTSRDTFTDFLAVSSGFQPLPVLPTNFALVPFMVSSVGVQYPGPFGASNLPADAMFAANAFGYNGIPPYSGDIGTPEDYGLEGTIPDDPTPTPTPAPTPTDEPTDEPTDDPPPTDLPPMRTKVGCTG